MPLPFALVVAAGMLAQSPVPSCPADRPVDELIAEVRAQSKKQERNKNPLPDDICIFGWCSRAKRPHSQRREPVKDAAKDEGKSTGAQTATTSTDGSASDYSSSKTPEAKSPEAKCDVAMELALAAAHDVDVADYQFEQNNYKGALLRLKAALAEKPGDAAIHVRLGRVFEKMKDSGNAIDHYQEALKAARPAKWTEEAKLALVRLQPPGK